MSGILIREHTPGDKAFIREMLEAAAIPTYPDLLDLGKVSLRERMTEIFEAYYGHEGKRIWIAETPGGPQIGMIWIQPSFHPVTEQPDYLILNLAVVPEARGHGLGKHLLETARGFCESRGIRRLRLFVSAANAPAIALYQATGFQDQTREMLWRF